MSSDVLARGEAPATTTAGGHALRAAAGRAPRLLARGLRRALPPLLVLVVVLLAWQAITRWGDVPKYLVPAPTDVAAAARDNASDLLTSLLTTAREAVTAFVVSGALGILGAIALASSRTLERSVYPYAIVLQTIPVVATAPLIVIWFGASITSVVVIAAIMGFFPVLSSTLTGLRATDHRLTDLFALYDAGRWQTLWRLRVPAALPYVVSGLRVSSTLAVVGAIVGEYIAGIGNGEAGLGYAITQSAIRLETAYLFAAGIAASILGIAFFQLVNGLSRLLLGSWHESELRVER
ncbi:ABC transporter permease [Patulibacter defluvii]|uniref:ABC transporter permease n=1 Tax=Patulibacter defluvii TaxID=3095358 RepID=UPI002A760553|nr:ABC transporter permease [Patulibacter sp. DM4]